MDGATIWGAIGALAGVLALVGIVVAVLTYVRQFPKRQLEYLVRSQPLIAPSPTGDELTVTIRGSVVKNPHAVTVLLTSNSNADISSKAFDGDRPIVIRATGADVISVGTKTEPGGIVIEQGPIEKGDRSEFWVRPQLIKPNAAGSITFVTDGRPESVIVDAPLIDIKVTDFDRSDRSRGPSFTRWIPRWTATMIGGIGLAIGIVAAFYSFQAWWVQDK